MTAPEAPSLSLLAEHTTSDTDEESDLEVLVDDELLNPSLDEAIDAVAGDLLAT
jgi:hypothetical protein